MSDRRAPRPSIDIQPYDDTTWEVYIDAQTTPTLNASIKVGVDDNGNPMLVVDPDSDEPLESQSNPDAAEHPYAYWKVWDRR